MSKFEDEVDAIDEILENVGLVKGQKFAGLCKFLLNTGSLMKAFSIVDQDNEPGMKFFVQTVMTTIITQHTFALGIRPDEMKEAIDQAVAIERRLNAIDPGGLNA